MTFKIDAPKGKIYDRTFVFPARVYYEDTDAGGIVYYANYLKFAERARSEYLRHVGTSSKPAEAHDDMCGFVVRHLEADYRAPARLDDLLTITCTILETKGASIKMHQEICRNDEVLVAIDILLVYISLKRQRPIRIPDELKNKMLLTND